MPNDPPGLAVTMGPELPFPFTLAYLELALEFHLDHPGGESPLFMLFDMMDVVGSAPAQNTQEFRKYMLNKLSYWIPFTKFVAEREIKDMNDIGKLVGVVKMLTAHNMLDPNFVYRCFGYAIYQCGKIDRTGLMVNRLHRMMFHLQANGLIEKGNYTPPDPRAHPPRGS
ncbi:hypothetical protein GGR53DRAFT_498650 [Hypoxylon sp. FL1150]|nr:hypothetical protein GGR53DRAFT_498650 [Hypoxylon sp. FL1150]